MKRYALLMCAHDNVTARLVAGGAEINVDNLLKIDGAMAEIRSVVPRPPPRIELEIAERIVGICPACKHEVRPYEPPPDSPPPAPPSPPTIDAEPIKPSQAQNVVKLPPPRRHPGGIHDQPGARMRGPSYAYCAGGSGTIAGPFSAVGPRPNFEAHHALPGSGGSVVW